MTEPSSPIYIALVGAPLGHSMDFSVRSLWLLQHAPIVLAEDAKVFRRYLSAVNKQQYSLRQLVCPDMGEESWNYAPIFSSYTFHHVIEVGEHASATDLRRLMEACYQMDWSTLRQWVAGSEIETDFGTELDRRVAFFRGGSAAQSDFYSGTFVPIPYLSDQGSAALADPGLRVTEIARSFGLSVQVLPGVSSMTTALGHLARPIDGFTFAGFLPKEFKDPRTRCKRLQQWGQKARAEHPILFLETPYRMPRLYGELQNALDPEAMLLIAYDLSLDTEFVWTGQVGELGNGFPNGFWKGNAVIGLLG